MPAQRVRARPVRHRPGRSTGGTARRTGRRTRPGPARSGAPGHRPAAAGPACAARPGAAAAQAGRGNVDVRHLAAGVHARVGPARHGQRRRLRQAAAGGRGLLRPPAGRSAGRAGAPSRRSSAAVVAEIEPDPDRLSAPSPGGPCVGAVAVRPAVVGVLGAVLSVGRVLGVASSSASASSSSAASPRRRVLGVGLVGHVGRRGVLSQVVRVVRSRGLRAPLGGPRAAPAGHGGAATAWPRPPPGPAR